MIKKAWNWCLDTFMFFWEKEFIRYLFVGGCAYILDHLVFFIVNTVTPELGSLEIFHIEHLTNAIAVLAGFIAGTLLNTILSMTLVFRTKESRENQKQTFAAFVGVSAMAFVITVLLNQLCIRIWGSGKTIELIYSCVIAIPMTLFNYFAKKVWLAIAAARKGKKS